MSNFWDSVVETAKSFGKSAIAPAGAVWDLASAGFDDKDDNFGTLVNKVAGRGADFLDPILNNETLTGMGFHGAMEGLDTAYREGVSEPVATAGTVLGHVAYKPTANWGDIFSGETWSKAYDIAQHRSIGQAYALTGQSMFRGYASPETNQQVADFMDQHGIGFMAGGLTDPLDERAYKQMHKHAPFLSSMYSGTSDFAARWYLDPGVVGGKAAGAVKLAAKGGKLTQAEHMAGLKRIMDGEVQAQHGFKPFDPTSAIKKFAGNDLHTRTEKYLNWLDTGADGGRLNSTQIFVGTPELRTAANGRQVAGLLDEAGKIENEALRNDVRKHILSVAYGDTNEIFKARQELADFASINDELKNIAKGNVLDLKTTALGDQILANPVLHANLQGQLDNMPEVANVVDSHVKRLELLVGRSHLSDAAESADTGIQGVLKQSAGVSAKGKRAVGRELGHGLLRDGRLNMGGNLDKPAAYLTEAAQRLGARPVVETIFQKSPTSVPMRIVTAAPRAALAYARMPQKFTDALRQVHFNGRVNLHNWDAGVTQLDAMMKHAGVEQGKRWNLLSQAHLARTEAEKQNLIERIEHDSIMALAEKHNVIPKAKAAAEKAGEEYGAKYLRDFISEVVNKGSKKRAVHMAPRSGRVYSAASSAEGRVDLKRFTDLGDDGVPVAMPLLETQLANDVPLVDIARIDQVLKRDNGFIARHAKAWANMRVEADRLRRSNAQIAAGSAADKTLQGYHKAMDELSDAAARALRVWKYSVLFRLGYPLRIVTDDQARIWSQIGAGAMLLPLKEKAIAAMRGNGTRAKINEARAALLTERDTLDGLVTDEAVNVWRSRDKQIRDLNARIEKIQEMANRANGKGGKVGEARRAAKRKAKALRGQRDQLQAMQSDPPEALRQRVNEIDDLLRTVRKDTKRSNKRPRLGEADVTLADGTKAEGAFGGAFGDAWRKQAASNDMWHRNLQVGEERAYQSMMNEGNWQVVDPTQEVPHLTAWADVLNHQMRQSKVAMHFIKGGDVDSFVKWLKEPAQRELRERLSHYANDPEDWGHRVEAMVDHYLPTQELRDAVANGKVSEKALRRMWPDQLSRPTVHGATVAHNLGNSRAAKHVGNVMNKLMSWMSEVPTDRLSRHPYFAAVYKSELNEMYVREVARGGKEFAQKDLTRLQNIARKRALQSLKQTLFDIESHSNAAHMLRFISPFFAAHQEAMQRWWRIIGENPQIIRRFQQTFDMPKKLGLVVDENGDPVKDGAMVGPNQYLLLQMPEAWGGNPIDPTDPNFKGQTDWKIGLNSFNLILQSGSPLNPGVGPIVSVPAEAALHKLSDEKDMERIVRLLNPYPSNSAGDQLMPATIKRVRTLLQGEKSSEYMYMWSNNFQDRLIQWRQNNPGRQPTKAEQARLWEESKHETQTEAWLRLGQNALSPFPANPQSRFAVVRAGWQKIAEQMSAEGRDYDWAVEQFKSKYGEAFLPLITSGSNNVANLPVTNRAVASLKSHRGLLDKINPRLHGAVVGPEGAYDNADQYSQAAAQYLRNTHVAPGSSETYLSYDDPNKVFTEGAVREGWSQYGDMMDSLQAAAVDMGAESWRDVPALENLRQTGIARLMDQNPYWGSDYRSFGEDDYQGTLDDLRAVANNKKLANDPARQDVQVLKTYLMMRDMFQQALDQRAAAGGASTMQAQSNADLQAAYIKLFGRLEESNLDFQRYMVNGVIDRDPFLRTDSPQLEALKAG